MLGLALDGSIGRGRGRELVLQLDLQPRLTRAAAVCAGWTLEAVEAGRALGPDRPADLLAKAHEKHGYVINGTKWDTEDELGWVFNVCVAGMG